MRRAAAAGGDNGSASLWVLAFAMLVWAAAAAIVTLGVAVAARHRVATAADVAALAGAAAAANTESTESSAATVCAAAQSIAGANGAQLVRCEVSGFTVEVVASIRLRGLAQLATVGAASVTATAKAGPG